MACVAIFYTGLCFPEGANLSPITLVITPQLCSPRMTSHQFGAKTATGPPSYPSIHPSSLYQGVSNSSFWRQWGRPKEKSHLVPAYPELAVSGERT